MPPLVFIRKPDAGQWTAIVLLPARSASLGRTEHYGTNADRFLGFLQTLSTGFGSQVRTILAPLAHAKTLPFRVVNRGFDDDIHM